VFPHHIYDVKIRKDPRISLIMFIANRKDFKNANLANELCSSFLASIILFLKISAQPYYLINLIPPITEVVN